MSKPLRNIFFVAFITTAIIFILTQCKPGNKNNDQAAAKPKSPPVVSGYVVKPERLNNVVRTSGSILAFDEVELKAETSGRIVKIYFNEGTHVQKGQLLIKINDEDLQAQLRKADLQIKLTESQNARQEQLLKLNATSQQEYDVAVNQLNSLKADKEVLQAAIDKTEIRAPFAGVIGLRYVSEGTYVTPASRIASIQNINPVKIDFSIPEKYSGMVKKGDEITFKIDADTKTYKGTVYAVEPKIDPATRTVSVRALCDNKNEQILPGSFAKIELGLKEIKDALMIPTQALIPVLKGETVFAEKDGKVMSVPVKSGVRTDVKVQIIDGLAAGDTVIITGMMQLKPDMPVKVIVK